MLFWLLLSLAIPAGIVGVLRLARTLPWHWLDALLLAALVPVALFSVRPYLGSDLAGAGDSHHYALQVADAVSQMRAGVMPVMAGQSDYAFNGNIHTLRTAPYFTHLAGLLDLVTWHRLSVVQVQNLTAVVSALLAAWFAYFAARQASGGHRPVAALLASLYVLSPAVLGPLAINDMFATYMAAPWIIVCWCGLAALLAAPARPWAHLLAAGALAMTWYAHSPLAAWLTPIWATVLLIQLLRPGRGAALPRVLAGAGLLAALAAYAWTAVITLGPAPAQPFTLPFGGFGGAHLMQALREEFHPFSVNPWHFTIQLGWSLWALVPLTLGLALWRRQLPVLVLAALCAGLLFFLLPFAWGSEFLWRLLPTKLAALTAWPPQRLCPLLAGGVVIAAATSLRGLPARRPALQTALGLFLLAGVVWSMHEARALFARPGIAYLPPASHAAVLSQDNFALSRYSYAFVPDLPPYFTHGWADAEFETRLLDPLGEVAADNANAVAAAAPGPFTPLTAATTISLEGPADYLLCFSFADPAAKGELTLDAPGIHRAYTLPSSGGARAFGAGPDAAKAIPLRLRQSGPHPVTLASSAPGTSFRIVPFDRSRLPVQVESQTPLRAKVQAAAAGFLETPRVFFDGYAATVNGAPAAVRPSPHGLVMVPVPAGESQVVLTYRGPLPLRLAWVISILAFAAWPWLLWRTRRTASQPTSLPLLALLGTLGLIVAGTAWVGPRLSQPERTGALRLQVKLPASPSHTREPLITLGQPGAADCLYLIYEQPGHLRVGLDHWAYGGPVSEPIPVDFTQPQTFEVSLPSLGPAPVWPWSPPLRPAAGELRVRLNGQLVLTYPLQPYPARADQVYPGRNPVGSSAAAPRFSGFILSVEPVAPPPAKP